MQLNIGQKIRELRRRDGRTQEALADAIGVTSQAVSRWEANGGYPDMEMIPSIANYFHVSIDALFGYHDEREENIKSILSEAEKILLRYAQLYQGSLSEDVGDCIKMLRTASEEFPNETKILLMLAQALYMWGWHKYGGKARPLDESGIVKFDTEYNSRNIYWQEVVHIYERLLKLDPMPEDREVAISRIVPLYAKMGEYEKAKALAEHQNSIAVCKERLLPLAACGEEKVGYQEERIMALLSHLRNAVVEAVAFRPAVSSSAYGQQILLSVANLYETVFNDGRFGKWHGEMGRLYLTLVEYEILGHGETQKILAYFDKGFEHMKESIRIYHEGDYRYSAPLTSNLKGAEKGEFAHVGKDDFWEQELRTYPQNIRDEIRKNPKYAECFA